ncbi:hypothetical protein ABW19_dt0210495 [Dactylella cylindrospora]|nr:hypothetical protein ABW19_dt0210495 [Dactylella cylindrospora]
MSDNNPRSPEAPQTPLGQLQHREEEHPAVPPPSYEDHFAELPASEPSTIQSYPPDVKHSSGDWPSEPLSQVPTARSDVRNYNSGLPSPSTDSFSVTPQASLTHTSTHHRFLTEPDASVEAIPPPAYSEVGSSYQNVEIDQNGFQSKARMLDDGRIDISINQRSRNFANILLPALNKTMTHLPEPVEPTPPPEFEIPRGLQGKDVPKLNIVIQIIGSRGDVQPFVALGKVLKNNPPYHRVRIATHATFYKFVEENGLEFFSIGGDPAELMAFMVKNPGLMPGWDSLRQGDVGKRRRAMYEMLLGCWRSCIETGNGLSFQDQIAQQAGGDSASDAVFVADAIIANPPSFAHIHCAERLAIPLHLMFTMPWTPTQSFPHPLANIRSSNTEANITNFLTYTMVELMTWQGLGDLVNKFREKTLGLDPISTMWAPGMIQRLSVPHTYCWSPALIPKPQDWGHHIKISGFFFLDLANNYTPPEDLAAFLDNGPPPVYIGFGSIVVDDPNHLTNMIFEAIRMTGVRALVSKGWGGLGGDALAVPENVFMLGNCPHDWLFKRVSCVVHHGGAGTTAIGVALGKPTVIVPFFGDQPFWGSMVYRAGAGPEPVPFHELTAEKLADAIRFALSPEAQTAAGGIAGKIKQEAGTVTGSDSFHASLDKQRLRCLVDPRRAAVWRVKRTEVRLSAVGAAFLQSKGLLDYNDLKLCRHIEWNTSTGPIEPISGAASALLGTIGSVVMGVGDFPKELIRAAKHAHATSKDEGASITPSNGSHSVTPVASQTALSGTSTPSRVDSFDSTLRDRDSEVTSLSSLEAESRRKSVELPELPELPGPPVPVPVELPTPVPGNLRHAPTSPAPGHIIHPATSPLPLTLPYSPTATEFSTGSHRSMMGSALSGLRRSRSNSPRRLHKERNKSHHDTPRERSASPHGRRLHKERSGGSDMMDPNKLRKEKSPTETGSISSTENSIKSQRDSASLDKWINATKGAGKIAESVAKSPLDFTLALAQGFHNAPLLYGDSTVRKQDKITGVQSGLKVAGKEFAFGLYDGISGLVTQPIKGAREEGHGGFWKGVGKGVGGLVLKPGAAIWGLPGYTFKGIYEEYRKLGSSDTNGYILAARITQGIEELKACQAAELDTMLKRWSALSVERAKGKGKQKEEKEKKKRRTWKDHCPSGRQEIGVTPGDEATRELDEIEDAPENRFVPVMRPTFDRETMSALASTPSQTAQVHMMRAPPWVPQEQQQQQPVQQRTLEGVENHEEIERAIQESVRQTSRGDAQEDQLIEQAIRTSLTEVVNQQPDEDDDLVLRRAITASLNTDDKEHADAIQQAITRSLTESHAKPRADVDPDELARAIEESKNVTQASPPADEDLKLALQLSKKEEEEKAERERKEKEEEETVMNYVKRMSLVEQKYKAFAIREDDGGASSVYGRNPPIAER